MHVSPRAGASVRRSVLAAVLTAPIALTACASGGAPAPGSGGTTPSGPTTSTSSSAPPSISKEPFTIAAAFSAKSLGMENPAGLAVGPDGNAYVADGSQHITVVSPAGKVVRRWGGHGKGPGQFNFSKQDDTSDPTRVSAFVAVGKDGTVYVSDTGNARVQVFTAAGKFIRAFGHFGRGADDWLSPSDLAVDTDGSLYVADDAGQSLWRFDNSGAKDWTIRAATQTDEDLAGHSHLAGVDDHHRLVFTVDENSHLVSIDARGHKVDSFGVADGPDQTCASFLDGAANVYILSCLEPHDLTVVDRAHRNVAVWSPAPIGWPPHVGATGEIFSIRGSDGALLRLTSNVAGR